MKLFSNGRSLHRRRMRCSRLWSLALMVMLTGSVSACGSAQSESVPSPVPTDSNLLFPDTSYASVGIIVYQVDLFDSLIDGMPTNLDDLYGAAPGIFTFRGSAFRDAPFVGHVQGRPDTVSVDWCFSTGYDGRVTDYGVWGGGTGWTGQPLYVCWPDSCMERFRSESTHLTRHFSSKELIVGSLASRVYFIDFETGDSSRHSIAVHNPIKGTVSLDPTLNGNLYVGQGIPASRPFGAMVVNLFQHKVTDFYPQDRKAWRGWGAYDSSPLRVGNFLFRPGENGTIYKYSVVGDSLKLHSTLKFKKKGRNAAGMEASLAAYRNYGYISDNHGHVLCFNLATMQPVWCYDNHDDSDASPVLAIEEGHPFLYTGSEVDKQGAGCCYVVKLDALTGALVWEQRFDAGRGMMGEKKFDGGLFATPLLGRGNCEDMLFINVVTNAKPGMKGDFVALNRKDGSVCYRIQQKRYAWSSPVALLNENNEMFVFTADVQGRVYLYDAKRGETLLCQQVGLNFEASPIVVDNHVVIGSRGRKIYRLTVKQSHP